MFQEGCQPGKQVLVVNARKVQKDFNRFMNLVNAMVKEYDDPKDTQYTWQAMISALATVTYNSVEDKEAGRKELLQLTNDFYQYCVDGRHKKKGDGR